MKKTLTALAAALSILASTASATEYKVTRGTFPACVTSETASTLFEAIVAQDRRTILHLLNVDACGIIGEGIEYRVIDLNLWSPSKIRLYGNGNVVEMWTSYDVISASDDLGGSGAGSTHESIN